MNRGSLLASALALCAAAIGCNNTTATTDAFVQPDTGPCSTAADCPGSYCNPGSHHCCVPTDPPYELCGDSIDQNCDMHDESCGDQDLDGIEACRAGQDPLGGCDCDDERADVRPPVGTVAGAPEICDGRDNNCDGRVDEASACCTACMELPDGATRADVCTDTGECDCAAEPGVGPCAMGMTCCSDGCVDLQTDVHNCRYCGAACTAQADRCTAGNCACGDGPVCNFTYACNAGACATM